MLTIKQVAARLNVSAKLVYALCSAGRIESVRYGLGRGTIRISEESLEHYMEQARACAAVPALPSLKHLSVPSGHKRA